MAHSDNHQSSQDQDSYNRQKSQALSRDIEDLNTGLRVDFDQKLAELAVLLARFKALVAAPSKDTANDHDDLNTPVSFEQSTKSVDQHNGTSKQPETTDTDTGSNDTDDLPATTPVTAPVAPVLKAYEPARFETGLHKLNSQLYRFRLELDQELEFREEPLHVHFNKESDLSQVLQQLNDKSSEINPDK